MTVLGVLWYMVFFENRKGRTCPLTFKSFHTQLKIPWPF